MVCASPAPAPRPSWHRLFLKWLPRIRKAAAIAFRNVRGQDLDDLIAESIANAYVAMSALADRSALNLAFPSVFSRYAISQIKEAGRVGTLRMSAKSSPTTPQAQGFLCRSASTFSTRLPANGRKILVEDHRAGPADLVQTKLDFADYLRSLPTRQRIAKYLAKGETTSSTSRKFGLSAGRNLANQGRTRDRHGTAMLATILAAARPRPDSLPSGWPHATPHSPALAAAALDLAAAGCRLLL